jgi:Fic family protein
VPIGKETVQRIHALVMTGKPSPDPYRDGQNVIRESASDAIACLPPEATDVPGLMADLLAWITVQLSRRELPVPIVAAVTHYQYATVHPYYDGNGRTARLLATLVLHRAGYGLKGIYSLDQHYARDLAAYYKALTAGLSHNYYPGRGKADITGFIDFFCQSMTAPSHRSGPGPQRRQPRGQAPTTRPPCGDWTRASACYWNCSAPPAPPPPRRWPPISASARGP